MKRRGMGSGLEGGQLGGAVCALLGCLSLGCTLIAAPGSYTFEPEEDGGTAMDGGPTDGGTMDAGDRDGGSVDGGSDAGEVLDGGTTDAGCASGEELCDDVCVDTSSSVDHCGACGVACPSASPCRGGHCRPRGTQLITIGSPGADVGVADVTTDSLGRIYAAADFSGTLELGGDTLVSSDFDGLVASFTPDGMHRWTVHIPGTDETKALGVDFHESFGVVAHISFRGTITLDGANFDSAGERDVVVVGLNPADGSVRWTVHLESPGDVHQKRVVVGPGRVYLPVQHGAALTIESTTVPHDDGLEGVLVALDVSTSSAAVAWTVPLAGQGFIIVDGAAASASGDLICAVGFFTDQVNLPGLGLVTRTDAADGFVACVGADGTDRWSQVIPGVGDVFASTVAVGAEVIIAGRFASMLTLAGETIEAPGPDPDVYVASLSASSGEPQWLVSLGMDADFTYAEQVALDATGAVVVAAQGEDIRTLEPGMTPITTFAGRDGVVCRYLADGTLDWARSVGGPTADLVSGLRPVAGGPIWASGFFTDTVDFGGLEGTSPSARSGFLWRFEP